MNEVIFFSQDSVFSPMARHFADLMARLADDDSRELRWAAALAVQAIGEGHVCVALPRVAAGNGDVAPPGLPSQLRTADMDRWADTLRRSPVVGRPGEFKPLILDEKLRLYLYRYWAYEKELADTLRHRAACDPPAFDPPAAARLLDRLFPAATDGEPDWQQVAAGVALHRRLCIISGGPGTGKTHTVVRLLALLQGLAGPAPLRVALAAPTGKAAGRLEETVRAVKKGLAVEPAVRDAIPDHASTIHRLLGVRRGSPYFRHDRENPLPLDLLVIDEASMVDLALMAKLLAALPEQARLVLLGDKDQLASVEAGSVLGDLCGPVRENRFSPSLRGRLRAVGVKSGPERRMAGPAGGMAAGVAAGVAEMAGCGLEDCIVLLEKSFRFRAESGIARLAGAVNRGQGEEVLNCLTAGAGTDLSNEVTFHPWRQSEALPRLASLVREEYGHFLKAATPLAAHAAFSRFRLLCGLRRGEFGVERFNGWVEEVLAAAGLIRREGLWYPGRPVMITRNDYGLRLYNGDIGITVQLDDHRLRVAFLEPDNSVRLVAPARVGPHETAFAVTVHKSQGSEFDRVALLLPDRPSPVVTRELLYTAISRARQSFALWGDETELRQAVGRRVTRWSGLTDRLWPGED